MWIDLGRRSIGMVGVIRGQLEEHSAFNESDLVQLDERPASTYVHGRQLQQQVGAKYVASRQALRFQTNSILSEAQTV